VTRARVLRRSDRRTFRLGAIEAQLVVGGGETAGAFTILEAPTAPKVLAGPLHTHHHEDAMWYVIDGEFGAQVGDVEFHEDPGAAVFAPRAVPHTYWNPGTTPARYLEIAWPAGLDSYVERLGALLRSPGADVLADVAAVNTEFGIEMDWNSLDTLIAKHGVNLELEASS
jgi:mannose-6-phosphate isomerase-like protein (cupin superfamily)